MPSRIAVALLTLVLASTNVASAGSRSFDEILARTTCASIGLNAFNWHYLDRRTGTLDIVCGSIPGMPTREVIGKGECLMIVRPSPCGPGFGRLCSKPTYRVKGLALDT